MQKLTLNIKGMKDVKCEDKVVAKLKKLDGIFLVNVDYKNASGVITFDETKLKPITIAQSIKSLGYEVTADIPSSVLHTGGRKKPSKSRIILGVLAILALCIIALELYGPTRGYIARRLSAEASIEQLHEQQSTTYSQL